MSSLPRKSDLAPWALVLLVLALLAAVVFLASRLSNVSSSQSSALRGVICFFEAKALSGPYTAKQKHQAVTIYGEALAVIHEPPCS